jgi:hypothetical protein
MSLNDGSFAPMPAASSSDLQGSKDNRRADRMCCCCSRTSKNNTLIADENRSKTRLVRLVFSHLAWQQFVALLFVAKAWDVGFYGEPMAMFAPAMFEDSLDGMCMIFFPIILLACRFLLSETKFLFWLLHILVFVQAFAWVGIGQIIGYGRTMIIAAITALGSAIVAGIVANFPTKKLVPVMKSWRFCLITYVACIVFCGLSCLICRDSLSRKGAFSTAWIISTMWICCCIGTVRNLVDRIYSRDVSRLTGVVLLDMYQLLLLEFLFQIFKAAISCKNLRRVASYYPVDILKPAHRDLKKDLGEEV